MHYPHRIQTLLVAAWFLALTGCSSFVAEKVALAPNADRTEAEILANPYLPDVPDIAVDDRLRVAVPAAYGDGPAELAVWIIDANDEKLAPSPDGLGLVPADAAQPRNTIQPRGTMVLLHGFKHRKTKRVYLEWARLLSAEGFRCVLIDHRGHGDSTGKLVGFGVRESADAVHVLDALEARGQLVEPIGVLGGSLGAASAIQLAARDSRIDTVIAVAPYTRLDAVMESFSEAYTGLAKAVPSGVWKNYAEAVCKRAGVTLDQTDNVKAIAQVKVPVLLIAGASDERVPLQQVQALQDAAPAGSELMTVDGESHNSLGRGVIDPVRDAVLSWIEREMKR